MTIYSSRCLTLLFRWLVGWGGRFGNILQERVCRDLIHMDSAQNPIQADLSKLKTDKPDDYNQLRAMGFARKWSIIIYPDDPKFPLSSRDDLLDCLYNYCVQHQLTGCLSPLHDKDLLLDGSLEKPHYHFYTVSRSPSYAQQIASLCYFLDGFLPPVKRVENELGLWHYITHNTPESADKARYDSKDIVCINGYNPPASGNGSTQSATQELLELVDEFDNLAALTAYIIHRRKDLFNVLIRSKNLIATYYMNFEN